MVFGIWFWFRFNLHSDVSDFKNLLFQEREELFMSMA